MNPNNEKALFRRAHAYKTQEKYEEACRDLQLLMKVGGNKDIKKELDLCMSKMLAQKKAQKEAEAHKPKIAEVKTESKPGFKKVQIEEEDSDDSDDEAALAKLKEDAKKKTKLID